MGQQRETWASSFDSLIEAGHRHAEIMGYTWAQYWAYRSQAARRKAAQQRDQLVLINHAMAGGKGAADLLKALNQEAKG